MTKTKSTATHKAFTIAGIVLCVILIPILLINLTLIVKSYTNKDKVPSIGGTVPMIVLTDSMAPTIKGGDLIFCKTIDAEDVKVGDIITFYDPAGNGTSVLTHRVIEIVEKDGQKYFRTQGDANNTADKDLVPTDALIGRYKSRIAGAGNVAMFMQSTTGLIICVVLPIILLVGYDVVRRRLYEKTKQDDTDALMAELEALRAEKAAKGAPAQIPEEAPAETDSAEN